MLVLKHDETSFPLAILRPIRTREGMALLDITYYTDC